MWTKTADGVIWRLAISAREARHEVFASAVSRRLNLARCVRLGELGTLEMAEGEWEPFRRELLQLADHAQELRPGHRAAPPRGRKLEYSVSARTDISRAIDALDHAEKSRGRGCVLVLVTD